MFRPERILTLDIGSSELVLAEFSAVKPKGLELVNYGVISLGADPDSDTDLPALIVHALRQVMKDRGIRTGPVLVSIPGQIVFPRYVKLPPVSQDKIAQIVRYEAVQNVPFSIDEVVWDYQLIGSEQGDLSVMLVAVKTEMVQKLTDCVEAAGLEPEVVDVSPMALYNTLRFNYPELTGCTMILDIGARTTNVIFAEGKRVFTRSVPVGGNAITKELMKEFDLPFKDAEQLKYSHAFVGFGGVHEDGEDGVASRVSRVARSVMTRLHAEVSRTVNFYRSQQEGSQPTLVLLAGGSSCIPHTDTFLKDKLKVDVDYLNPFRNVAVSNRIESEEIGRSVQVLGEVVGLALRRALSCPIEINVLPPELTARKRFQRRLPYFAASAVGLILILLVWWAYFHEMRGVVAARLDDVKDRVQRLSAEERQSREIQSQRDEIYARTSELAGLIRDRTRWIEILTDIHSEMPDGMWLVSVEPRMQTVDGQERRTIEISGMGFDDKVKVDGINKYIESLKVMRHFTDQVSITKSRPVPGNEFVNEFAVEVGLK